MKEDCAPQARISAEPLAELPIRTAADKPKKEQVTLFEALASEGITAGSIVQSIAGHDYSRIAIVIALRPPFAQIVDGRYRPIGKPKVKRLSHLRPVAGPVPEALSEALALPEEGQRNSAIRRLIRQHLPQQATRPAEQSDNTAD